MFDPPRHKTTQSGIFASTNYIIVEKGEIMNEKTTNSENTREYSAPQVLDVENVGALLTGSNGGSSGSWSVSSQ